MDVIAADGDEAPSGVGRGQFHLDDVRAALEPGVMLGEAASVGAVLRHANGEGPDVVPRFEPALEIAQHEHAIDPGSDQPGKVVDRGPLDTQKGSRDTPEQAGHPRRAYRRGEDVSSRHGRVVGFAAARSAIMHA